MWESFQYVTSGLTLIAFVVAVIVWVKKNKYERLYNNLIHSVDEKERATIIKPYLKAFNIINGVTRRPPMKGLQETNMNESFQVFLSYNSQDKAIVQKLAQALKLHQLRVWLDEEQLVPGHHWQEAVETIIQTTQAAAVLIGESGLGPWEDPEMRACLDEFVKRKLPVIPVLLPGTPAAPTLPLLLRGFTWVDLRGGLTDPGLERLVWGITGVKPTKPSRPAGGGSPTSITRKKKYDLVLENFRLRTKRFNIIAIVFFILAFLLFFVSIFAISQSSSPKSLIPSNEPTKQQYKNGWAMLGIFNGKSWEHPYFEIDENFNPINQPNDEIPVKVRIGSPVRENKLNSESRNIVDCHLKENADVIILQTIKTSEKNYEANIRYNKKDCTK